jgi:hypothetical protein
MPVQLSYGTPIHARCSRVRQICQGVRFSRRKEQPITTPRPQPPVAAPEKRIGKYSVHLVVASSLLASRRSEGKISFTHMDQLTTWQASRLTNLIAAIKASATREEWLGGDDKLKEIGRLTLVFARLEEAIALDCEILLLRPELRGFHSEKGILEKHLTEKLDLDKRLVIAVGCLHSVETQEIEKILTQVRELGERRNAVIHGQLSSNADGQIVFRNRGKQIAAESATLGMLTRDLLEMRVSCAEAFAAFYRRLPNCGPSFTHDHEEKLAAVLEARMRLYKSSVNADNSKDRAAKLKAEHVEAKRVARNSKRRFNRASAQLRTAVSKLPKEYQNLLLRWHCQSQRVTTLGPNGVGHAEGAKLERLSEQIRAYEQRENISLSDDVRRRVLAAHVEFLRNSR